MNNTSKSNRMLRLNLSVRKNTITLFTFLFYKSSILFVRSPAPPKKVVKNNPEGFISPILPFKKCHFEIDSISIKRIAAALNAFIIDNFLSFIKQILT